MIAAHVLFWDYWGKLLRGHRYCKLKDKCQKKKKRKRQTLADKSYTGLSKMIPWCYFKWNKYHLIWKLCLNRCIKHEPPTKEIKLRWIEHSFYVEVVFDNHNTELKTWSHIFVQNDNIPGAKANVVKEAVPASLVLLMLTFSDKSWTRKGHNLTTSNRTNPWPFVTFSPEQLLGKSKSVSEIFFVGVSFRFDLTFQRNYISMFAYIRTKLNLKTNCNVNIGVNIV